MTAGRRPGPWLWLALIVVCGTGVAALRNQSRHVAVPLPVPAPVIRLAFDRGLDSLGRALDRLQVTLANERPAAAHSEFRNARAAYKRLESLLEALAPAAVEALNGPAPEADEDKPYLSLGAPAAFQIVESAVFTDEGPGRDSLLAAVGHMRRAVTALRRVLPRVTISNADLLDALRLEIARIATLGVAGFDAPASNDAIAESAAALEGARSLVQVAAQPPGDGSRVPWGAVDTSLARAAAYLRAHAAFDSLDRLMFIVDYANPAARAVAAARRALHAPLPLRRLWRQDAATVFEAGAFDASAYASVDAPPASPELIALGRRLFADPVLSGPRTRSCAFCHDPNRAFTDGLPRSAVLATPAGPHRNTPTLLDAALSPALFDDLRAQSLEVQAGVVIASPTEMGGSVALVAARLERESSYRAAFERAFAGATDRPATPSAVLLALAAYVRTLAPLDSRFDRAVRGDTAALSASERRGFTVFMGKGRCGTCHFLPLFNGTMPPSFARSEAEIIGVPARPAARHRRLDADPGLGGVDFQPEHQAAFKVPTLRNVASTAPYMHNGVFRTLEEVIDYYDRGGGAGLGVDAPNQTLSPEPLHLSDGEKANLVAFLRALTDSSYIPAAPSPISRQASATCARSVCD